MLSLRIVRLPSWEGSRLVTVEELVDFGWGRGRGERGEWDVVERTGRRWDGKPGLASAQSKRYAA